MHAEGLGLSEIDNEVSANGSVRVVDNHERRVNASQRLCKIRAVGNGEHVDLHRWTVDVAIAETISHASMHLRDRRTGRMAFHAGRSSRPSNV